MINSLLYVTICFIYCSLKHVTLPTVKLAIRQEPAPVPCTSHLHSIFLSSNLSASLLSMWLVSKYVSPKNSVCIPNSELLILKILFIYPHMIRHYFVKDKQLIQCIFLSTCTVYISNRRFLTVSITHLIKLFLWKCSSSLYG